MARLDPTSYRAWFETPLGRVVDADEKRLVAELARLGPGDRVLDVGCGDGNFTELAAQTAAAVVGLDSSSLMLGAAATRLAHLRNVEWVEGDAASLPFPDESFDVVLAVTVMCFVTDPATVLREAHRVLRPGGRLIAGELGRWSTWALIRRVSGALGSETWKRARFFSLRELKRRLAQAGFVAVEARGAVFYPPIARVANSRLARAVEQAGPRLVPGLGAFVAASGTRRR